MTVLLVVVPQGIVIATIPVLLVPFGTVEPCVREIETPESARQEADFWHRMLGHKRGRRVVATPELLSDGEVARTDAASDDHHIVEGQSVWITSR
jgi:hypothetical protein